MHPADVEHQLQVRDALSLESSQAAHSCVDLVVNGGFESPALGHGSWSVFHTLNGWTTQSGCGLEIQNHVAGSPLEGAQHVELDSNCPATIFQNLNTVAGRTYLLSFGYSTPARERRTHAARCRYTSTTRGTMTVTECRVPRIRMTTGRAPTRRPRGRTRCSTSRGLRWGTR